MAYEFTTDKRGNRRFSRTTTRVASLPRAKVAAKPAVVEVAAEPVADVETAAVSVPTTPKPKAKAKSDG